MKTTAKAIFSFLLVFAFVLGALAPTSAAASNEANTKATALKQLRLFRGVSDNDFALDRAPTRTEALVMLIRSLGKESEALSGTWSHPFTDVPSWADSYVGYSYQKGLTRGVSATQFGTGNADSDMYLTFMLRALGYSDTAGDFTWNAPDELARSAGILPESIDTENFLRADVVLISWAALQAKLQNGGQPLFQKLVEMDAFNSGEYAVTSLFVEQNGGTKVSTLAELRAAVQNKDIRVIQIASDIDIADELFVDREDGPETLIHIEAGVTLTVSSEFTTVGCFVINDGSIVISGSFDRGLSGLTNNGSIAVRNGGIFASGMSDTYNRGNITVDNGGNLPIERGTQFHNYGNIINNGHITIDNGGSLSNSTGEITNNGTIDLCSYFDGNIEDIKGTGKLNDKRT